MTEQTFESLAFMLPGEEAEETVSPDALTADIAFTGPREGQLRLLLPRPMLAVLAANMLGLDQEPSVDQQHDACGEVLNVICGNLLPIIGGVDAIFSVLSPRVPAVADPPATPPAAQALVCLDEGNLHIALYLA